MGKNARVGNLRIAGQIDRDINLTIVEKLGDFFVALSANIVKLIKCRDKPLSHLAAVITPNETPMISNRETIVLLEQLSRQRRYRMWTKIGGEIGDPQLVMAPRLDRTKMVAASDENIFSI